MAKMTKAQRSAAARKAARTRKRNTSTPTRRRRRTTRKKGLLSQFGGVEGRNAFRAMTSGAVGGALYLVYEDQVDLQNTSPEKKGAIAVLGAYVLATMGKKPNMASGIVGAAAYDFFKVKGLLGDAASTQMARMKYADPLANIPVTLSDDTMYLAANGEEFNLADDMMLQDGYYPAYADTSTY